MTSEQEEPAFNQPNFVLWPLKIEVCTEWQDLLNRAVTINWQLTKRCLHFLFPLTVFCLHFCILKLFVWYDKSQIKLFHNEWQHYQLSPLLQWYQFSPLYNDISVLCKLNNTDVTIWWVPNIKYTFIGSLKLFIGPGGVYCLSDLSNLTTGHFKYKKDNYVTVLSQSKYM